MEPSWVLLGRKLPSYCSQAEGSRQVPSKGLL